ncbi:MAG: isocitrate lyase/phosphoenolpyruvate mutase family protein [Acidobacteriota bacterium]|nr:isocitrate lyase/phosphoenolpyruvate mutase family protein [Acidobacteriota bacterium]
MQRGLGAVLREKVSTRRGMIVPGAANALSARVIEDLGFEAVYLSGAGIANTFLGVPDIGLVSLAELAQHTAATRDAIGLPLIVDADTGFGNAINVGHTVRTLERAGANAIQLEDQVMPKRCGHFTGKAVVGTDEMTGKIKAAVDARSIEDLLIIARTDALAVEGIAAAIERAQRYVEAGADMTFIEAPRTIDELRQIAAGVGVPQVANMVVGGKTPILNADELGKIGFGMVLYANAALQGAVRGMQNALSSLKNDGLLTEQSDLVVGFSERQRLVQKDRFDELESRYAVPSPSLKVPRT